jgi:hypothetical protein
MSLGQTPRWPFGLWVPSTYLCGDLGHKEVVSVSPGIPTTVDMASGAPSGFDHSQPHGHVVPHPGPIRTRCLS